MSACKHCGGLIMEIGKAYGYAGPVCHCIRGYRTDTALHIGPLMPKAPEVPYPDVSPTLEEMRKHMEEFKNKVKKPSFSHILNLCEQLSMNELAALIGVLNQIHDCASLSATPGQFKGMGKRT